MHMHASVARSPRLARARALALTLTLTLQLALVQLALARPVTCTLTIPPFDLFYELQVPSLSEWAHLRADSMAATVSHDSPRGRGRPGPYQSSLAAHKMPLIH